MREGHRLNCPIKGQYLFPFLCFLGPLSGHPANLTKQLAPVNQGPLMHISPGDPVPPVTERDFTHGPEHPPGAQ